MHVLPIISYHTVVASLVLLSVLLVFGYVYIYILIQPYDHNFISSHFLIQKQDNYQHPRGKLSESLQNVNLYTN